MNSPETFIWTSHRQLSGEGRAQFKALAVVGGSIPLCLVSKVSCSKSSLAEHYPRNLSFLFSRFHSLFFFSFLGNNTQTNLVVLLAKNSLFAVGFQRSITVLAFGD